jgi:hypothetical protein
MLHGEVETLPMDVLTFFVCIFHVLLFCNICIDHMETSKFLAKSCDFQKENVSGGGKIQWNFLLVIQLESVYGKRAYAADESVFAQV